MITHQDWPIDPGAFGPFLIAVALVELTPGPNMAYLAALSAASGRRAGLACVAGVTLGLAVYMLGAVFGVTELIAASPAFYALLRWAGVLFLFYLAWEAWRGSGDTSPEHTHGAAGAPFVRGLIANLLNPKAAIFYVTLLPAFVARDHAPFWAQALIFGSAHLLVSVVVHGAIVLGAARAGDMLARAQASVRLRQALALGIALTALWLAWETRR